MKRKKIIQCINCRLHRLLIPRCEFEVEITDASGTVTATMSDKLAEKMLSMTADQIYETIIVKFHRQQTLLQGAKESWNPRPLQTNVTPQQQKKHQVKGVSSLQGEKCTCVEG